MRIEVGYKLNEEGKSVGLQIIKMSNEEFDDAEQLIVDNMLDVLNHDRNVIIREVSKNADLLKDMTPEKLNGIIDERVCEEMHNWGFQRIEDSSEILDGFIGYFANESDDTAVPIRSLKGNSLDGDVILDWQIFT